MKHVLAIIIVICIATVGFMSWEIYQLEYAKKEKIEPLTVSQQRALYLQLRNTGFERMVRLNCYDAIVVRINTDRWTDSYCAHSYKHLDFDIIKAVE